MFFRYAQPAFHAFLFLLVPIVGHAGTLGVELNGLSTHFSNPPIDAPRKIDDAGVNVYNPGLGLDLDFRSSGMESGFSPLIRTGYFRDCQDFFAFYGGAGVRYRAIVINDFFIGGSLLAGIYSTLSQTSTESTSQSGSIYYSNSTQDHPEQSERTYMPLLVPTFEIGFRVIQNHTAKLNLSYAPVLDLMLTSVTFAYSFN